MAHARLQASQLTRTFGDRVAVHDLSLSIDAGELVALLGPNGAGKTTTLRMLGGVLAPSSGAIAIDGQPVSTERSVELRRSVGMLTEAPGIWDGLSVRMNLVTYARLYGLSEPDRCVDEVLDRVDLTSRVDDVAGTLSKGLKQRLALARALVHRPPIVLLDEPTAGLDPAAARDVRDLLMQLRRDGRAVLVSTHNLTEAEALADRIAVLKTRLMADDTPAALRGRTALVGVTIEIDGEAPRFLEYIRGLPADASASGNRMEMHVRDLSIVPDIVTTLVNAGARIRQVTTETRSLEAVYLDLVGPS